MKSFFYYSILTLLLLYSCNSKEEKNIQETKQTLETKNFPVFTKILSESSGVSFSNTLKKIGFKPCEADKNPWISNNCDQYEYIFSHVDHLMILIENQIKRLWINYSTFLY